jgi:hypothetical protein
MRFSFLPLFLFALGFAVLPAFAEEDTKKEDEPKGITAWDLSCQYSFQGKFIAGVVKGIDCNVSTVAFPGISDKPIQPFGDCYYLDNNTKKTFFIPLKTSGEWDAFKQNLPGGVTLRKCD